MLVKVGEEVSVCQTGKPNNVCHDGQSFFRGVISAAFDASAQILSVLLGLGAFDISNNHERNVEGFRLIKPSDDSWSTFSFIHVFDRMMEQIGVLLGK
jgi:hypothetical protein